MTAIRSPAQLTVNAWEHALSGDSGPLTERDAWSRSVLEEGLHLDFSPVEFAYLGALARALLLVDAAVHDGIPVSIILPTGALTEAERRQLDGHAAPPHGMSERHITRRARARAEARAFMRDVGFIDALRAPHWPASAVQVSDDEGVRSDIDESAPRHSSGSRLEGEQFRQRKTLPFRWVHHRLGTGAGAHQTLVNATRRLYDLGLSAADSRGVTYTVMAELVENVSRHAATENSEPHALVAAVLLSANLYTARRPDLPPSSTPLIDSLSARRGSQVLDLVVGDSGRGLLARLTGAPVETEAPHRTILSAFDRKLIDDEGQQREANGLWRVARLVRSYQGTVKVTTAGTTAGKAYPPGSTTDLVDTAPVALPGTLVEVALVIETPKHGADSPSSWRSTAGLDARFAIVPSDFDPVRGISDEDRTRLHHSALAARTDDRTVGLIATIPIRDAGARLSDGAVEAALARLLEVAAPASTPTAVIAVFSDADPRILDLSVAGVNADEERSRSSHNPAERSPIMVFGSSGAPLWCGGPRWLRKTLEALTSAGGALTHEELARTWADIGHNSSSLRDHPHLVDVTDTEVVLRISVGDVLRALGDSARQRLADAIRLGGPGVEVGYFRTPTLRLTNRWITASPLVNATIGTGLTAWLLARRLEQDTNLSHSSEHPLVIVQVASATEQLASQLSECLSVGGRFYAMPGELDLDGIPVSEQVPTRANVVLCTNVLSTENTTRRAAAAIASKSAVPVAVVCVVDSRAERKPIRIFNRAIPVFSLVEADIAAAPANTTTPVDIDPLLLDPLGKSRVVPDEVPIDDETLLDWCAKDIDWLRLGHIERMPRTRHFSAYLRVDRLLNDRTVAAALRTAVRTVVDDIARLWRDDNASDPFATCQVWYPGPSDDYAGRLADLTADALALDGRTVTTSRSVPRAVAGARWTFPTSLDVRPAPGTVVVVDFGALSSTSVQQMMRLAVESGATAVCALVLLNQLDEQDADSLRALSAMQARRATPNGQPVPTQVRFLTSSGLGAVATQNCFLCGIRDRAEDYSTTAPVALRPHALQLRDRTRLRTRQEAFGTPAADVFNVPVNGQDLADYLRWRGLLLRAMRVTSARQEVIDKLDVLAHQQVTTPNGDKWTRNNLLRVVAAEQHWLKLPPLRYEAARDLLATICTTVLRQPPTTLAWLRAQAVMVIAASAPNHLVQLLPGLVTRTVDEPVMINQLLLECHRLLRRPMLDSPVDLDEMELCLQRCRDRLEKLIDDNHSAAIKKYLRVLAQLLATLAGRKRTAPLNPQEAWHLLREDYKRYVETHSMEATLLRVRDFVEDLRIARPRPERIRAALADWDRCSTHLSERALVNLSVLTDILAGDYVADRLGQQDQRTLLAVAAGQGTDELQEVLDLLHDLTERPWEPDTEEWLDQRTELLDRLKWWHRIFMTPHAEGDAAAQVVELVASLPASPAASIRTVLGAKTPGLSIRNSRLGEDHRVFCPSPLLDDILAHVLDNITHHATPGTTQHIGVEYRILDGMLDVAVHNSGTHPRIPAGHGLRSLNEKLRPFGGSLIGHPESDGEWTFTTTASLQLWRGA